MTYNPFIKHPCNGCPFLKTSDYLTEARAEEIAHALLSGEAFSCHKTLNYDTDEDRPGHENSRHCAGAFIVLDRMGKENSSMQIARRLKAMGMLKFDEPTDPNEEVVSTFEEFIKNQGARS